MKKLLSVLICAAILLSSAVIPSFAADYTPQNGAFIFDSEESLDLLSYPHDLTPSFDSELKALKLTASGNLFDPRVLIRFDNTVSADEYKYLLFTYMMPASVSASPCAGEIFLSAGSTKLPTAGKSVSFALTRGSVFITERFDLSSYSWWTGNINSIRLDVFDYAREGDVMYVDSVILAKSQSDANAAAKARSAAKGGGEDTMAEDFYSTSYENDKYTSPFWKGNIVYNEAVYPIKDSSGGSTYQLMYSPDQVVSVYDAQFRVKYRENIDYKVSGNKITFLQTGSIPLKSYTYLHPNNNQIPAGYSGWSPYYKRHAAGDGKYDYHTAELASQYINVTYTHTDSWNGPVPAQHADVLPRTAAAIQNKGSLNIVYYGDSICGGARASSYQNLYPYAEWWNQQISTALRESFGVNVHATYSSVGGSTASSMSDASTIAQYVTPYNPDLVVIEFGVNDAQNEAVNNGNLDNHKATFKNAVMSIMSQIRAKNPNCEFLLVAPYYSNIALFKDVYFEVCRDACNEIAEVTTGTAVADVTTFHDYLIGFKNYADFSGDNLCHPNDYMSRIFAQICLEAIVPGGVPAYIPNGEITPVNPDEPDNPEPANDSFAAPSAHGWYWGEEEAYGFINSYGGNGQDVKVTCDLCLLPASENSCAHLFTDDNTGGLWLYADHAMIGGTSVAYSWGDVNWSNWHTVTFAVKNGKGSVTVDGELIGEGSGFRAHEDYQLLFSHYGSMAIDNLSVTDSSGRVFYSDDFEDSSKSQSHMGEGLGEYVTLQANTISYDTNGGEGSIENQIKVTDIPAALSSVIPTRDGYTFSGWATSKTATEAEYTAGATYTGNCSVTLYAVWQDESAHTHSYGEWQVKTKPTCIEPGVEVRSCSCGSEETKTIPAAGHVEGETENTPATCTENGRSIVKCKICGYPVSDIPIAATGHSYSDGVCTKCGAPDPDYTPVIKGDIDCDGKVTSKDMNHLKLAVLGKETLTGNSYKAADMDSDEKISVSDANLLKQKIIGSDK